MIRRAVKKAARTLGYEIQKIEPAYHAPETKTSQTKSLPRLIDPVWPLPRGGEKYSDEQIRNSFAQFPGWHYAYEFEGGVSLPQPDPKRPLQRFRHFMPYVLESQGGSLKGKRVLDIACNSGFWSIQCALLGAEVIGIDARPELVEQANLIKAITGITNADFRVFDFWRITPEELGGHFDVVLNLGLLYHLSEPLAALRLTQSMTRDTILLDTALFKSEIPLLLLGWEAPVDIRYAAREGLVARPSRPGIELMLRDLGTREWFEIPIRSSDMPKDYLQDYRASWLIKV